jgi:hypothetical protein
MAITYSVENITPQVAEALLSRNTMNRPLARHTVERYAADMKAGRWQVNGEDLLIADDGTLLNGQHRLRAVIMAGVAVPFGVKRGLPRGTFVTLDAGRVRRASDVLALTGVQHANTVAAAAKIALLFEQGRGIREDCPRQEVTEYAADAANAYLAPAAQMARSATRGCNLTASPLAAVVFLANRAGYFAAEVADFLQGLATGEGLVKGDPRLTLREWATAERMRSRSNLGSETCFSATARAWTAYARGEELRLIRISGSPNAATTQLAGFRYGDRREAAE